MAFNITWSEFATPNITGFVDAMVYYNSVTDNIFGVGFMIALYAIFLMVFSRFGIKTAFVTSNFIMFVLSALLFAAGVVGNPVVLFFSIMTAMGVMLLVAG